LGANLASQPTLAPHLKRAKARGAAVVTIDVRESEAAERAERFYAIGLSMLAAQKKVCIRSARTARPTNGGLMPQRTGGGATAGMRTRAQMFSTNSAAPAS
jgi:hypothetical protein